MTFYFPAYSILYFLAGAVALYFSCVIWMRRPSPGAVPFSLFMSAVAGWIIFRTIEFGAIDFVSKVIWAKILLVMAFSAAVLWFCFALDYSGFRWWRRPLNFILLSILPLVTLLILSISPGEGWEWLEIPPVPDASGHYILWSQKPLFWVGGSYLYILVGVGFYLLWRFISRNQNVNRGQIIALLLGTLIPCIGIMAYAFGFGLMHGSDIIPLVLFCAGILYAIIIFQFRFLELVPVARNVLVEQIPYGIVVLNSEGCIADINPSGQQMIGQTGTSILGKRLEFVWPGLERLISSPSAEIEKELVTDVGLYLEVRSVLLKDKQKKELGKLVVLRDITERKLIQKKLEGLYQEERQLRNSLQAEIEKRSKYTRALVHELNTPLTSILASGEILELEVEEKTLAALVKNIRRASLNLKQRIGELTELARGEVGLLKIHAMPLEMGKLVEEVVEEMCPVASGKKLKLKAEIGELPLAWGDRDRLKQVMENLVGNAIRYTDEGKITVSTVGDSTWITVKVQDTGRGIAAEEMENLFDPYRRKGNDGQELGGLGIGLALSKIIIELHLGRIWAESVPGQGSIISFTIPVYKDQLKN